MRKLETKLSRASLRTSPCSSPYSQIASPVTPIASPVTPLMGSSFSSVETLLSPSTEEEEERAIADKRFYLHPSPLGNVDPLELLPLFPLTSPIVEIEEEKRER
ncbi:VQ motif-containing protein 33 [Linum perenne]